MQKDANLVELEKCCQTHIFLQNFVLVQPRTSSPKVCKQFQKTLIDISANFANVGVDTESAKAREERDEEGGERELGPGKDAEFRESQETMRWQEMKKL